MVRKFHEKLERFAVQEKAGQKIHVFAYGQRFGLPGKNGATEDGDHLYNTVQF